MPRPKTTKLTVLWYSLLYLGILGVAAWGIFGFSGFSVAASLLAFLGWFVLVTELYGRFLGVKVVECYQHYATEKTRRNCKCVPSCSEYAILCLKKYELIRAIRKIRKRLFVTCRGFDYILDDP